VLCSYISKMGQPHLVSPDEKQKRIIH